MVEALAGEVAAERSAALVALRQLAAGHPVRVILRADDSAGTSGDVRRPVLEDLRSPRLDITVEAAISGEVIRSNR